ncbi:helix-turn-helix domain-containing protein [Geochorda subterranea]|uniref:Response regulatory domain-containing protein n=1 Tax=Geochorda subterranea TaxID=3109564 RepID=A0ABZ1BMD6_9FIRM|nr:hypothetical protein [Limnochorda sp. LNt]WRP13976.1 hypothetical protein VLY81_11145 [Limnochorda sp. LNt]
MPAASRRAARPIRVLLVSASPFGRAYLRRALDAPGQIEVAGVVAGPDEALAWPWSQAPHVVVWDAEGHETQALARAPELARRWRARVLVLVGASPVPLGAAEAASDGRRGGEPSQPAGPVAAGRAFARRSSTGSRRWRFGRGRSRHG